MKMVMIFSDWYRFAKRPANKEQNPIHNKGIEVSKLAEVEFIPKSSVMPCKTGLTEVMPGLRLKEASMSAKKNNF